MCSQKDILIFKFIDELQLIEKAAKECSIIAEISAHQNFPNFKELQTCDKQMHKLLYFCDLWGFVSANFQTDQNIKDFSSFLLKSRRIDCSMLFEFHGFPFGMSKGLNELFSLYLQNSTIIFLTKNISDQGKLNLFKQRYLKQHLLIFEKAQTIAQDICDQDKNQRPYVCLQKDMAQRYRLLRVDIFNKNIVCFLD